MFKGFHIFVHFISPLNILPLFLSHEFSKSTSFDVCYSRRIYIVSFSIYYCPQLFFIPFCFLVFFLNCFRARSGILSFSLFLFLCLIFLILFKGSVWNIDFFSLSPFFLPIVRFCSRKRIRWRRISWHRRRYIRPCRRVRRKWARGGPCSLIREE